MSVEMIPVARPWLGEEEAHAAGEAVQSGWLAQGPRVAAFERAFAGVVDAREAVAVSSCTTALHLGLVVLGVGPGDEVVVPSLSFIATANAVRYVGASPVFADVDPDTGNLTAKTTEAALTPRVRAVIVVHQAGMPADRDELRAFCDARELGLLEDAACAAGSTYRGRPVGAGSAIAAWSFHPRKVITTGEGGMVTTDDPDWAARLRRLREHGMSVSAAERHASNRPVLEQYLETGFNYRMTDIQAAVGLVQLTRLEAIVARRRQLAADYRLALSDIPGLQLPHDPPYGRTNHQSYSVVLPDDFPATRDDLLHYLASRGVSARRGIMAAHLEPAYGGRPRPDLPVTERLTARSLILPLFYAMRPVDQVRVVEALHAAADGAAAGCADRAAQGDTTRGAGP
jgi:dTDP-4-amino-4,6-dideoxygalactose transaminase